MTSPSLLLVDDDPAMIQVMGRVLSGLGRLRFATSGEQALRQMSEAPPDVVLLDGEMPGLNGYEVCALMKRDPALANVPVIFVTGHTSTAHELHGLEVGAADFITKPISEPLLVARVRTQLRVKALTDELRAIAATDALTGVANRRSFDEALAREWRRAMRLGTPMSVLMIDVDHFKAYNDRYGHPGGDACLRAVAEALASAMLRPSDLVARYGGEEFAVLLPDTDRAGAEHVARRVLERLHWLQLPHEASSAGRFVSASVGVGHYDALSLCWQPASLDSRAAPPSFGSDDLLRAADVALYAAKKAGRARAWALDIDDADAEPLARPVAGPIVGDPAAADGPAA